MTTASPIPASIADACAAHDRHRLDVLDALLDEAAPSAVRELLGAALDLCASLRAERDEMTAQFDEFRRDVSSGIAVAAQTHADEVSALRAAVDRYDSEATAVRNALRSAGVPDVAPYPPDEAIDDYERSLRSGGRALQPVKRIGMLAAALASERAHLAACQTRIAGLEQAADERAKEDKDRVARMDAIRAALGAHPFASDDHIADRIRALTARVAEARPVLTVEALRLAITSKRTTIEGPQIGTDVTIFAQLTEGGPVTLPAQDRAEELTQAIHGTPREEVNPAMWRGMVERTRSALASLGAPPTSPPAARPVFAEVSEDELIRLFYVVGTDGIDHGEQCPPIDSSDRNGIRAVLARLEVSLVTPVDPEAVARDMADSLSGSCPMNMVAPPRWSEYTDSQRRMRAAAMRAALIARGIPVTPEVRK